VSLLNHAAGGQLHFVVEVVQLGNAFLETLAGTALGDDFVGLVTRVEGVAGEHGPVIEHALRESLALGLGAQSLGEA
jgi:hypothetical protein